MSGDGFSNSLHLLYTYGVVERIHNTVSSGDAKEFKGDTECSFDLFVDEYPTLIEYICYEDHGLTKKVATILSKITTAAYALEDLVEIKPLNLQEVSVPEPYKKLLELYLPDIATKPTITRLFFLAKKTTKKLFSRRRKYPKGSWPAKDIIHKLQDLLCELLTERDLMKAVVSQPMSFCSYSHLLNFPSLHRMTKRTGASCRYYGGIWSLPEGDTIVGLDSKKEEIIQWIFSKDNIERHPKFISIEGEAGAGKTTLAKMIYNDAAVQASGSFDLISWALAPPTPSDVRATLLEIVSSFTNVSRSYMQRMNKKHLEKKLHGILSGTKYLLILDDYREVCSGELVKIFNVGYAGSTIILVSADSVSVATKRSVLPCLSASNSWSLFARCAGFDEEREKEDPSFMTRIGRSIADNCHGCPQAIETLGNMLRTNRDEISWRGVKGRIIRSTLNKRDTAARNAFNANVEQISADLLHCLYVSSILSNSKVIPKDQLIFSWMALGLLHSRDGIKDPIVIGNIYCDELASSRCIVQLFQSDGRPMVLLNQQVASLQGILGQVEFGPSRYLISRGDESSVDQDLAQNCSTVTTFRFQNYVGRISKHFLRKLISRLQYARVLLLGGPKFEELPATIGTLRLLKYLSLAGNVDLKKLPDSICSLPNLQTLDLSGCEKLSKFPLSMHKLVSLRHLFLSTSLTKLPELPWDSLHHLRICNSPNLLWLPDQIPPSTLKVLQIHDCPAIAYLFGRFLEGLPSLQEISILNCKLLELTNWGGLGLLTHLEYLQIQGLPKLKYFHTGHYSVPRSLQHFVVSNCQSLISLPVAFQSCGKLVEMVIENCSNLTTLPKGIHEMTLQVLKIINCPKLITRCKRGVGDDWHLISHIPRIQLDHQFYETG